MTEILPPVRTTHTFRAPGGLWSYDMWGCHGRPILLIPTVLVDRSSWWPAAADLRPHATVIAVDLPGHGASTARERYEPDDLVNDLAQLIDNLHLRRAPVIIGHGPCATLATLFAARYVTHAVIAVDPAPATSLAAGLNTYMRAFGVGAIPEQYRAMIEVRHDQRLLSGYATGLRHRREATSSIGVNPTRLAIHSQPADDIKLDVQAVEWRHEVYDVPGGFAHLAAVRRFAADIRALL